MTPRKRFDTDGKVVEEADTIAGALGEPVTDPLEMPNASMRAQEPDEPPDLATRIRLRWLLLRLTVAAWIRRNVLMLPDVDFRKIDSAQRMIAVHLLGQAKMISEVRTRLVFHERGIPLLGESRRRYERQMSQLATADRKDS